MPLYDYQCDHCGHTEEDVLVKTVSNIKCSKCGRLMKRLVGNPALKFIGPGFYRTDHYKMKLGVKDGKGNNI